VEDKEKVLGRLEAVNELVSNISLFVTIFVFFVMAGQLLGVNMQYIMYLIITFRWYIPEYILLKYYGVFYGMAWALLLLMLWDSIYQNLYTRKHGTPNAKYGYYSSIMMFVLSFILAIAFHVWLFAFIAAISFITTMYLLLAPAPGSEASVGW
jgi:hypothetical protein